MQKTKTSSEQTTKNRPNAREQERNDSLQDTGRPAQQPHPKGTQSRRQLYRL